MSVVEEWLADAVEHADWMLGLRADALRPRPGSREQLAPLLRFMWALERQRVQGLVSLASRLPEEDAMLSYELEASFDPLPHTPLFDAAGEVIPGAVDRALDEADRVRNDPAALEAATAKMIGGVYHDPVFTFTAPPVCRGCGQTAEYGAAWLTSACPGRR